MLSSAFLQCKDVVHVMPDKCLQADNLLDIDKCLIICLDKI